MAEQVKTLIAGNWKMNGLGSALPELQAISAGVATASDAFDALICVPATLIERAVRQSAGSELMIGAQDCHSEINGAHTGDISAQMVADAGAGHVIVGHSERRTDHGETDVDVLQKAMAAHSEGLVAIICVGETREEREAGHAMDVVDRQLEGSVPDSATPANTVIAYEPVWAIGTGLTASAQDILTMHNHIRATLRARFGAKANSFRILYGGSMKPSNAAEILAIDDVNGGLIGGASLKSADFLAICAAAGA